MNAEQYAEFESLLPPLGTFPDLERLSKRLRRALSVTASRMPHIGALMATRMFFTCY